MRKLTLIFTATVAGALMIGCAAAGTADDGSIKPNEIKPPEVPAGQTSQPAREPVQMEPTPPPGAN